MTTTSPARWRVELEENNVLHALADEATGAFISWVSPDAAAQIVREHNCLCAIWALGGEGVAEAAGEALGIELRADGS